MMKFGGFVYKEIVKETEEKAVLDSKLEKSDSVEKEEKVRIGVSGQMGLFRSFSMFVYYRFEVIVFIRGFESLGGSIGFLLVLRIYFCIIVNILFYVF